MSTSQNLHKSNLGWFVWLENKINHYQMMGKSIFWIFFLAVGVTVLAAWISISLGIYETKLSGDFYIKFLGLSLNALLHEDHRQLWSDAFSAITGDLFRLFLFHGGFGVAAGIFLYGFISEKTEDLSGTKYIKGTKLVSEANRINAIKKDIEEKKYQCRFSLGRIPIPIEVEKNHVLIIAASGGGKGVMLTKIMQTALGMKSIKGVVHDNKPEWTLSCYQPERGDLIFNPLDARSVKWTVWNDIEDLVDIKNFAKWIVPSSGDPKGAFWEDSARGILESIMIYLWKNEECTNAAIRRMINMTGEMLAEELKGLPGAEYALKKDSISTLKTRMQWVDFLPDGDFSIREWLKVERGLLFLSNIEKTDALFAPVLSLFVNAISSHVLSLPDDSKRRFFFFLDEFTSLQRLDKIIAILKLGRSKGASVWILFQDFQQLKKIYSDEDMRTVINNCKNIAVGQINEPAAAKYLSERFGKQEFYEKSQTMSMGVADNRDGLSLNDQRKEDFVVKDSDLLNLKEREFFVKINNFDGVTKTMADIIELEKIAEGFVPLEISKEDQIALMYAAEKAKEKSDKEHNQEPEKENDLYDDIDIDDY